MLDIYNSIFKKTFWLIVIIEILSVIAHLYSAINQLVFVAILIGTLIISIRKIKYGFFIACAELFIGSFGYLFFYDIGDFRFSIRLGIFLVVFCAWLFKVLFKKQEFRFGDRNLLLSFALFSVTIVIGIVIGLISNHSLTDIFLDMNAYLYFGLLFVAVGVVRSWTTVVQILSILFAAITTMALKTFFLLFYFSHQTDDWFFRFMYTWVRDTRIGEIAPIAQNYYRIFFQSHIWALFAFVGTFVLIVMTVKRRYQKKDRRLLWTIMLLSSTMLLISYSRSFWLAIALTVLLIFLYLFIKEKFKFKKFAVIVGVMIGVAILELGFISGLVNIKLPGGGVSGISPASLVQQRISSTEEAALKSRFELLKPLAAKFWEQPIIGSGFATEVSYQTLDPRTKDVNGGWYTSYSFEWGYLDILVKIGIIGLSAYMFFIWQIFRRGVRVLKNTNNQMIHVLVAGILFALCSLLIVHATTPYLNHPLGILLIILGLVITLLPDSSKTLQQFEYSTLEKNQ